MATKEEAKAAPKGPVRTFRVKYNNWPIRDAIISEASLGSLNDEAIARKAMGVAFEQHLKGEWTDEPGRKIVLTKAMEGMWEGTRTRADGRVEDWYIMETTEQ